MGPDLIKEFLSRQNGKKRNRSDSFGMENDHENNERAVANAAATMTSETETDENPLIRRYIDLSFCYEDDDDEPNDNIGDQGQHHHVTEDDGVDYVDEDYDNNTLDSVSVFPVDSFNPRRLYQREGHSKKTWGFVGTATLEDTNDSVDPLDFQQFKAKFNSSVEALWKDLEPNPTAAGISAAATPNVNVSNPIGSGISSAFYATTSLNALAPFKKDLWNFWSNYQQHNFDDVPNKVTTTASTSSMLATTRLDGNSAGSGASADIANSSDYFSMPSNLNDFDKSVGSVRRTNEAGASLGAHTPSINVFLRNSIWSTSDDCVDAIGSTSAATTAVDSDESFLFKVWHSNRKLSELGMGNAVKSEMVSVFLLCFSFSAT